jgi:hypothetical protein
MVVLVNIPGIIPRQKVVGVGWEEEAKGEDKKQHGYATFSQHITHGSCSFT